MIIVVIQNKTTYFYRHQQQPSKPQKHADTRPCHIQFLLPSFHLRFNLQFFVQPSFHPQSPTFNRASTSRPDSPQEANTDNMPLANCDVCLVFTRHVHATWPEHDGCNTTLGKKLLASCQLKQIIGMKLQHREFNMLRLQKLPAANHPMQRQNANEALTIQKLAAVK